MERFRVIRLDGRHVELGAPNDKVWVYAIVRYSQLWDDLTKINTKQADVWTSGPGADFVKKYKLKPLVVST